MFTAIYGLFVSLFGDALDAYLLGQVCENGEVIWPDSSQNQYLMYGLIAVGIAAAVMVIYYYVIDHPRFNKWWSWLIMLSFAGLCNLFIGAAITSGDLIAGDISNCLVSGELGQITMYNCWMFGLANFLVSSIFIIILSFSFKWWSKNCKRSPF